MTVLSRTSPMVRTSVVARLRAYWTLIKSLQTGLLVTTGAAGYASARSALDAHTLLALCGSLFLAISGSTILNMVYDADIDALMARTAQRPLPSGRVSRAEAVTIGSALAATGVAWALWAMPLYGVVVAAGLFFDVVVYTVWLKRRTPWSIVWGGIAGGMPILAGRVLGTGTMDPLGILLSLAVLFWIPTHILTFSLKNADDYCLAGVPVFPNAYGAATTRRIITLSTGAAVIVMLVAASQTGMAAPLLSAAIGLGAVLLGVTVVSIARPSPRLDFTLYKLASLYMLGSMLLIVLGLPF